MSLTLDEIAALLRKAATGQGLVSSAPEQHGPLRWFDKEMRCANRGCTSPTYMKLEGIPRCSMHSLRLMNDRLANVDGNYDYCI